MINCSFWLYRKKIIFSGQSRGQNYAYFLFVQILEDKNFDDSLKYFQMGKIVAKKRDQKNYHLPQRLHPLSLPYPVDALLSFLLLQPDSLVALQAVVRLVGGAFVGLQAAARLGAGAFVGLQAVARLVGGAFVGLQTVARLVGEAFVALRASLEAFF